MKCPHCDGDIKFDLSLMREEIIVIDLKFQGDVIAVGEITEILAAAERAIKETARCLGSTRTLVSLCKTSIKPNKFSAELLVSCQGEDVLAGDVVQVFNKVIESEAAT